MVRDAKEVGTKRVITIKDCTEKESSRVWSAFFLHLKEAGLE